MKLVAIFLDERNNGFNDRRQFIINFCDRAMMKRLRGNN